jgi:Arc/MetJ-type ribon-helix-helix transcriptional regulator
VAGARAYKKVSVTLPADLLDRIRAEVGPGNLSAYLAEVLEEAHRQDSLGEFLDAMAEDHGPISEHDIEEELDRWDAALRHDGPTEHSSWTATG